MGSNDEPSDERSVKNPLPPPRGRGRGREPNLTEIAKKLQREMTSPERSLPSRLRALEIVGQSHRSTGRADEVGLRRFEHGILLIRFTNDAVSADVGVTVKSISIGCGDRSGGDDV